MSAVTSNSGFGFWFALTLAVVLGLAGGFVVAHLTGDFILPPLLGASFGGAASTSFDL